MKQLNFLETNHDIKLVGTWARVLGSNRDFLFNIKTSNTSQSDKKKDVLKQHVCKSNSCF